MGARTLCDDYYIIFITLIYIAWFQIYKLANSLKGQYHPPLPFLHNENILWHLPAILMSRRRPSKGKRKASPSPSLSSVEGDSDPDQSHPIKRSRVSSPVRVKQAVLAKVASKSNSGSSSKGLAGFAALINNTNLSAARIETNTGLNSGSSSKRSRGGAGSQSKAGKPVWVLDSSTC